MANKIGMFYKSIEISNFRGFSRYSCEFGDGVNVIIGRNGAGKSTLISAICRALSFIFSNDRSLGNRFLSQGNSTLNVRSFKESDYHFDSEKREAATVAGIQSEAMFGTEKLRWELVRRNMLNAVLYQSKYKEAFAKFMKGWSEEGLPLPLLAYFSDSYPHKDVKIVKNALDKVNMDIIPRNFGYYQWDFESSCTSIWETRFCNCLNRIQPYYGILQALHKELSELTDENVAERERIEAELARIENNTKLPKEETDYVENTLKSFANRLRGDNEDAYIIEFLSASQTPSGFQVRLHFKNGESSLMQDLPAGYRRLYSMVFDIAYRAYILNGIFQPCGIVLIDEIDLHLHPSLEKNVLNILRDCFPHIQFIVTSHSPIVITNLRVREGKDRILQMLPHESSPLLIKNIYGLDYNSGVEDVMGVNPRDPEIENLVTSLAFYEIYDLKQQREVVKKLLLKKLGGNRERLDAMVSKRINEMRE